MFESLFPGPEACSLTTEAGVRCGHRHGSWSLEDGAGEVTPRGGAAADARDLDTPL